MRKQYWQKSLIKVVTCETSELAGIWIGWRNSVFCSHRDQEEGHGITLRTLKILKEGATVEWGDWVITHLFNVSTTIHMIGDLPGAGNNPVASSSRAKICHGLCQASHDTTLSDGISSRYSLELPNLTNLTLCPQLSDMEGTTDNKDKAVIVWKNTVIHFTLCLPGWNCVTKL